jgi:hypothetical protein
MRRDKTATEMIVSHRQKERKNGLWFRRNGSFSWNMEKCGILDKML